MKNNIVLRPSYWASVSGGKDSLYMLKLLLSHPDLYPLDGVVHFELEIDYPFIKNVIDYMQMECEKHGIYFVRINPEISYESLYNKYGFPSLNARWCNSRYKLNAQKQLEKFLKSRGEYSVYYIGYCYDECKRYEKRKNTSEIYPLVDFKINEDAILKWAKGVSIFNNYYKVNKRCGCMFCPMASKTELAYLYKYYPQHFDKLMMARDTEKMLQDKYNRPWSVWCGNSKYDTDYIENIIKTKWINIYNEREASE